MAVEKITSFALLVFLLCANDISKIEANNSKTLKMVHLLYRHGARSPIRIYPSNPNRKYWPDGTGRLTQIGMQQQYELGEFLKERYMTNTTFLDNMYLHDQVYIRSSDSERCLQSALSQLAGMYPPTGRQVWNKKFPWQPLPVHTVDINTDYLLLSPPSNCPRLGELYRIENAHPKSKKRVDKHEDLLNYLTIHSGMNVTLGNFYSLVDTYLCEKAEGLNSPKWMLDRINEILRIGKHLALNGYPGSDEIAKLHGGSLLYKINRNMEAMSRNKTGIFKMNIFSGHDTSMFGLAAALNVQFSVPTFASCIMIELYKGEHNQFHVEIQYRNDSSGRLYPLKSLNCGFSCPLEKFLNLTKNRVTSNVVADCRPTRRKTKPANSTSNKKIILSLVLGGVVVIFVLICLVYRYWCRNNNKFQVVHIDEMEQFIVE